MKHLVNSQLFAIQFDLKIKEPRTRIFMGETDGDRIAPLPESVGVTPVDLIQALLINPRPMIVLSDRKKAQNRFTLLTADSLHRTSPIFLFIHLEIGLFLRAGFAGPKVTHLQLTFPWA